MRVVLLVLVSVLAVLAAPFVGPSVDDSVWSFVLWELRVPRVLMAAAVGACLGVVGAAFQAIFGNPLATPSTTGTTAGAMVGALAALVFMATPSPSIVAVAALIGALAIALPVAALASRGNRRIEDVLLAGVALTLGASALTTGLQVQADLATTFRAVRWSMGSLTQVGYDGVAVVAVVSAVSIAGVLWHLRALEALIAGEALAFSQGVDVTGVRTRVLVFGALGVAVCVAWCGPIAFVGLVVPHLVRLGVGTSRRLVLTLSAVCGAGFLVLCDTVARTVWAGRELPVGVLTAAIGAPLLVALVLRRPGRASTGVSK
jgi:iron complex transport system permease protein